MNLEEKGNSPPGTGGVAESRGGRKVKLVFLDSNERLRGKLFDPSTTPSLRATPPCSRRGVVLQFIHTFIDRACSTLFRTEGEHDIAGRAVATTHKTGTHKHHSTGDGCAGLSERSASRRDPILRLKLNGRIEFP